MESLLAQGVELMLLGMGVVFSFLILLVFCTTGMSWLVNRYFAEPLAVSAASLNVAHSSGQPDAHTRQVIEQAIRQHRARIGRH